MVKRTLALLVIVAVVAAGCLGGPTDTAPAESPTDGTTSISSDDVPGIANGSLTNASALARANEAALSETGGELTTSHGTDGAETSLRLRIAAGFSTYTLAGSFPGGGDQPQSIDIWSNETKRFVRSGTDGDARYRVVSREDDLPNTIALAERYLASGDFTVRNESRGDGTVRLTADEYTPPADGHGPFGEVSSYSGTLVVAESGQVQNLTVSAVDDEQTVRYRYELRETGIDTVSSPAWFDEFPESASLDPDVEVTVENSSYLAIRHQGGDAVPQESVLILTTNDTTRNATFETALGDGDVRYASIGADDGALRLTEERPDDSAIEPVMSPVSLSLVTDEGVTIHSGGMAWESTSASSGDASGGGSSESAG